MTEIIPAIIPKSYEDLKEKMSLVNGLVPLVQIDILDGKLTPEPSWPYLRQDVDPDFDLILKEELGFPFWDFLDFEVDLMVKDPENVWLDWITAGASRVIFHIESSKNISELVKEFRNKTVSKGSPLYVELGIAIDINTPNEKLYPLVESVDFVQFMGIEKIGFQGETFDERVVEKIKSFKNQYANITVSVDGGVNFDSAPMLIEAGADRLVSGSSIFQSNDIEEAIEKLKSLN